MRIFKEKAIPKVGMGKCQDMRLCVREVRDNRFCGRNNEFCVRKNKVCISVARREEEERENVIDSIIPLSDCDC